MTDFIPSFYNYWGKAEKDGTLYHLLPYHCLDVAAVAGQWWAASSTIRRSFCNLSSDFSEEQIKAWILFFAALHDYGKFDIRFQLRSIQTWHFLYPKAESFHSLPSEHDCRHYYHGESGLFWFMQDHNDIIGLELNNPTAGLSFLNDPYEPVSAQWLSWKVWLETVTGHHGHIKPSEFVPDVTLPSSYDQRLAEVDRQARKEWFGALERLFLFPAGISHDDTPPQCSLLMAGFCSVADWLGSRCDNNNFSYLQKPTNLEYYFKEKSDNDARRILDFAGIISRPHSYSGVKALLKNEYSPHSVQTLVDDLPLKTGLTIMEAPAGSGKTEAALSYAWRLVHASLADTIVFALPTQATANAMLERIELLATKLFDEHPNVLLAHGSASFNSAFTDLKHRALTGYESEDGWVQCSEWLAESRKRIFLGQIGICTIDQVLISVLPVRHRFVRGFGLGRSILIVDEVHAYDVYMYGLFEEVLSQQKMSGGSAILLSATLPERYRRQLCAAWSANLKQEGRTTPYPLLTWTDGEDFKHFIVDRKQSPEKIIVKIEPIRISEMKLNVDIFQRIIAAAETGAQVAIVCNLVDVAQGVARELRSLTNVQVDLFHARYCFSHRKEKELSVIKFFGPQGDRSVGRILVATQVIEQSLDIDFDWIITQLCPIDLLFQRIGRLHRHVRDNRPAGFKTPLCTVLLPEGDNYGVHSLIYPNKRILWRTAEMLLSAPSSKIVFPDAYRAWIETCYQEDAWKNEPEEMTEIYEKFKSEIEEIQKYKARFMIDTAMNPFTDTDERVMAITRDGDMNLTVVPYCQTVQGKMLLDGTVLERQDEYERHESLALNSIGVPKSWRYCFDKPEDGRFWLAMEYKGDGYSGCSNNVIFHYHKDIGLEKQK